MTPNVEHHAEYCQPSKPAVNVKDDVLYARTEPYATLIEQVGENVAESLYRRVQEGFWMDADVLADEAGYGEAHSEGRSGGWLVVSDPPDVELELEAWLKFASDIEGAIEEARAYYVELMREHLADGAFERSESAAMAARDIVTV